MSVRMLEILEMMLGIGSLAMLVTGSLGVMMVTGLLGMLMTGWETPAVVKFGVYTRIYFIIEFN